MDVLDIGDMFSLDREDVKYNPKDKEITNISSALESFHYTPSKDKKIHDKLHDILLTLEEYKGINRDIAKDMLLNAPKSRFKTINYFTRHISQTHYKDALEDLTESIRDISNNRLESAITNIANIKRDKERIYRVLQEEQDQFRNVLPVIDKIEITEDFTSINYFNIDASVAIDYIVNVLDNKGDTDHEYLYNETDSSDISQIKASLSLDIYPNVKRIIDTIYDNIDTIESKLSIDNIAILDLVDYIAKLLNDIHSLLSNKKQINVLVLNQYNNQ